MSDDYRDKGEAARIAIFAGKWGFHNFYLGEYGQGSLKLIAWAFGLLVGFGCGPFSGGGSLGVTFFIWVLLFAWAVIDWLRLSFMSAETFNARYNPDFAAGYLPQERRKSWLASCAPWLGCLALILFAVVAAIIVAVVFVLF